MKVLITGADGFIGRKLVENLKDEFQFVLTCRGKRVSYLNHSSFNSIDTGDIYQFSNWDGVLDGCSQVVHLASVAHKKVNTIKELENTNCQALHNLLQSCVNKGIKKFIYISTAYVHGKSSSIPITESSKLEIEDSQLITRIKAESIVEKCCSENGIDFVVIRPSLILSADAPGNVNQLVKLISKFQVLPFKSFTGQRSYLSISKLLDFIHMVLSTDLANNDIYLLSDDTPLTLQQVVEYLACENNVKLKSIYFPGNLIRWPLRIAGKKGLESLLFDDFIVDSFKANLLLSENKIGND